MNNKKTKILFLITQTDSGGAQKYVFDLATNLDKEKFEIEIAVGQGKDELWLQKLKNQGIKIWRLKQVVRAINPLRDFLSSFELFNLFEKSKPDIIHLNSSKIGSTGAVIGWFYKKIYNKNLKIIYTAHGFVFNEPMNYFKRKFYLWSEKISGFCKDKIICVSEHDKITALNHHTAYHKKFITIHNGIDLEKINFLEKNEALNKLNSKFNLPNSKFIIGTIANLFPVASNSGLSSKHQNILCTMKGIEYLIQAAKILSNKFDNLIFIVIGEGSQKKLLEKEIKKLNLENNFFLVGTLENASQYLPAFDIFCLPSIKEGFPYTPIEALSAGLPIVASQVGGILEIIEPDVNGILVQPKKPREFANAIEKLINNPELRNKFKKNNLEKVKQFSLKKMIKETEKIYCS